MQFDNLKKEKITINLASAQAIALLVLVAALVLFGLPFFLLWKNEFSFEGSTFYKNPWMIFMSLIFGIIVHELIHGLTWMLFIKNGFRSIKFGILWKMLTPYCHCKEPLRLKHYVIGALMPSIILGFIPATVALVTGNFDWLAFGIVFIMAAAGDFMIVHSLRKENLNSFVLDHPTEGGCYVFREEITP